ncbi:MAG: divergent polysaccharide deacetylase family protein [Patescibacteria group bacterium]
MKKLILIGAIILASFLVYSSLEAPLREEYVEPDVNPEDNRDTVDDFEGELAIIIDDLGYNPKLNERLLNINQPLTVAILPSLENTQLAINDFKGKENFDLLLHTPMEPMGEEHIEDKMLKTHHTKEEMEVIFNDFLSQMNGQVVGINNHKGSKFTSDSEKMREFLELVKAKNLFFIDSYTIGSSVGHSLAKEMLIPTLKRDVFLDYVDEKEGIREKLYEAVDLALENGSSIAIGHHKENTMEVLEEELPELKERGVKLVKVSDILE